MARLSPHPPLANAGADREVLLGLPTYLNGGGTYDPDANPLTLRWEQTEGDAVHLSSYTAPYPRLAAPLDPQVIAFQLTVSDSTWSTTDEVRLLVVRDPSGGAAPHTHCGPDQGPDGSPSGSGSDAGGAEESAWTQVSAAGGIEQSAPTQISTTGNAEAFAGTYYRFDGVADGLRSAPDHLVVFAEAREVPEPPQPDVPTRVQVGATIVLRADAARLRWEQIDGPPVLPEHEGAVTLQAPSTPARLVLRAVARAGEAESAPALHAIDVFASAVPTVTPPPPARTHPGNGVLLEAGVSAGAEVRWQQTHGPALTMNVEDAGGRLRIEAPSSPGRIAFALTAVQGGVESAPSLALVQVVAVTDNEPPQLLVCRAGRVFHVWARDPEWDPLQDPSWEFGAAGWTVAETDDEPGDDCLGGPQQGSPLAGARIEGPDGAVDLTIRLCDIHGACADSAWSLE
jgi:hypothetical protein